MLAEVGNLRDDQREIPFVLLVWMDVKTHEEIINESAPKTRSEKGNGDIRLFPNHVLGLFIGPQSEEDSLPKLVFVVHSVNLTWATKSGLAPVAAFHDRRALCPGSIAQLSFPASPKTGKSMRDACVDA
jgi:hypothetical protein